MHTPTHSMCNAPTDTLPVPSPHVSRFPSSFGWCCLFQYYPGGLNRTLCCRQSICTECFLQVQLPNLAKPCPFCELARFTVVFEGPLSEHQQAANLAVRDASSLVSRH